MEFPLFLNSSLPRSGSTLVQNLLAQNPAFHCTATNDLLDMVVAVRDRWMTATGFMAQGLATIEPRMKAFSRHALYGFYEPEFTAGKVVFDKSRGWLQHVELLEEILERPIKLIVCVRDVRDILASFEKIFRQSSFTDHPVSAQERLQLVTARGRAERLLQVDKTVGYTLHALKDAFDRNLENRLVLVPYHELTHAPVATMRRVCDECGLKPFTCDPGHVPQVVREDDTVYGMNLHTIKTEVIPDAGNAWVGILPEDLAQEIDTHFGFIQRLAKRRYVTWESNK